MKKFLAFLLLPLCCLFCACTSANGEEEDEVKTGTFYTITEAYEKGYLTREDVMSIAYYHGPKDKLDANYKPLPIAPETLTDKMQEAVKETYVRLVLGGKDNIQAGTEIIIDKYYGTYNGNVAVMMTNSKAGYPAYCWTEQVADVSIDYGDGNRIYIWVEEEEKIGGTFKTLTEVYEEGSLTSEEVLSIAFYHSQNFAFLEKDEKLNDENYKPLPRTPKHLPFDIQEAIQRTFLNSVSSEAELPLENIHYYGTYNGYVAVWINALIGYTAAEWTETVAGVEVNYNCGNRIYLWRLNN